MTPETLERHFDLLTDAPNAAKKLRELVLQLAVQGKLVEQDPSDEPAGVLLEEIESQARHLKQEGHIRKFIPFSPVSVEETRHETPTGWTWVRLNFLGELTGGSTPSKRNSEYWDGKILWVSPKDMKVDRIVDSEDKVTGKALKDGRLQLIPKKS